jgi:fructosamine-3-kinase
MANSTWRVELADGRAVVVKHSAAADPELFAVEAEGLRVLREAGLRTPAVIAVDEKSLTLEALSSAPAESGSAEFWERAGRAVAGLHEKTSPRFGWERDGWLGRLTQQNEWDDNGHRFFATRRILRYLSEPKVREALDGKDLAAIERLAGKLEELVPKAPAVLTHGDLWRSNVIADDGEPVFIDPAVSWTWAEVDLSMAYCTGGIPERFFDAYHEIHRPESGWRDRMELLNLRELLSVVAHFGATGDYVEQIRGVVRHFDGR